MMETKRYVYHDFGEYCTIIDTNDLSKTLNDFYNELVEEGYLEDYDNDMEVVLELAEEKYHEYLQDNCMYSKKIVNRLNEQEETIKKQSNEIGKLKLGKLLLFKKLESLGIDLND